MAQALNTDTTYKLSTSLSLATGYRVKEVKFGDGYKQTVLDGVNYEQDNWSLTFIPMDSTTAIALETLLKNSVAGTTNCLSWTPPGESTTKYWTANDIKKDYVKPDRWKISCSLGRVYI